MTGDLKESHLRSVLKAFTWRIFGSLATAGIAYWLTGDIGKAFMIGGVEFVGKILLFYFHERVWQLIPRGTVRKIIPLKKSSNP